MRQRLHPEALSTCLREHLAAEIHTALNTSTEFLAQYEVSAPVLTNLQCAQRALQTALSYANAASLIAGQEVR